MGASKQHCPTSYSFLLDEKLQNTKTVLKIKKSLQIKFSNTNIKVFPVCCIYTQI